MQLATLIGDLVASRATADRGALHTRLVAALGEVNDALRPAHRLRITVGDEYQGAFATVADAVRASLLVRLALGSDDVRHGIGWGSVEQLQAEPPVEDGPGWWAARAAIEEVHAQQQQSATRWRRTAFRAAEGDPAPALALAQAVEAALLLRDQALDRLDERSLSVLSGMLAGKTQREISEELQVSASAISQRIRADGLVALAAAQRAWESAPDSSGPDGSAPDSGAPDGSAPDSGGGAAS